ncbi:MAG: DUF3426 domain-containing protein, partial [Litorimonas sp.]
GLIWGVALGLLLLLALAAALGRQAVVDRYPRSATLYNAVGLTVRANGLEIDPPTTTTTIADGVPVIRIETVVRNLTREARPVPLIELTLHDGAGNDLSQWFVEPPQAMLDGRGRLQIQTEYADPPAGVAGLRYRFAEE